MFERFTFDAREVIRVACEEAVARGASQVSSEDYLIVLTDRPGTIAFGALHAAGVTRVMMLNALSAEHADSPLATKRSPLNIPFAREAKGAMESALRIALQNGHDYIGPEHLLLAVIRDEASPGCAALKRAGVDIASLDASIVRALPTPSR